MPRLTVLVTGGAGYVGSHTVLQLLQAGHEVVVVDSCINAAAPAVPAQLPPALARVQQLAGRALSFHQLSLLHRDDLTNVFKQHNIDVVIHFAALKAVGESIFQPLQYYRNNLTATITLLEVMESMGVQRLVFSSSATVYGVPQYLPIDEDHPTGCGVTNPYGQTKHMCEQILKDLVVSNKVNTQ